jgi:hypothetical protein
MDAMILSTVHRHRILKAAAGTLFLDVWSLREGRFEVFNGIVSSMRSTGTTDTV